MDEIEPDYNYEILKVNKTPEEQARILEENVKRVLEEMSEPIDKPLPI